MISFHFHPPELRIRVQLFAPRRDHHGGGGECFRSGSAGAMKNSGGQRTLINWEQVLCWWWWWWCRGPGLVHWLYLLYWIYCSDITGSLCVFRTNRIYTISARCLSVSDILFLSEITMFAQAGKASNITTWDQVRGGAGGRAGSRRLDEYFQHICLSCCPVQVPPGQHVLTNSHR